MDANSSMIAFEELIYVIAISLQLSGAEILILSYWRKPIGCLTKEELNRETHVEDNSLIISSRSEMEIIENILLNRCAFTMIAFGYLVGIFGSVQKNSKWLIFLYVIVISIFLVYTVIFFVKRKSKNKI